jgi:hypothetical protein
MYLSTEDSEAVLVSERYKSGLKKPSSLSEQTSDSTPLLDDTCIFKACTQLWPV